MPDVLSEGARVFLQDLGPVLTVVVCMLWGSIVTVAVLHRFDGGNLTPADHFSLAMGGWIVATLLMAVPTFLLGAILGWRPDVAAAIIILAVSAAGTLLIFRAPVGHVSVIEVLSACGLLALLVVAAWIRLAFVSRTPLPLYFDSAEHYRIAQVLVGEYVQGPAGQGLTWPAPTYYHLGFHLIVSVLSSIAGQNLARLMLVAGQLVVAALPVCLYVIVKRETSSTGAAVMAVLLGMIGWYMPAYAVNWGKYPALFSLPAVFFCLDAAYLGGRSGGTHRRALLVIAAIAAVAAFGLQTRSIILIAMAVGAWWVAGRWAVLPVARRRLALVLIVLISIAEVAVSAATPTLASVIDPYAGSGLTITILVGLLTIPAFLYFPRLAFAAVAGIALLLLGLFVPVPGFSLTPLLDRPLVEMVLFVPLTLLAAGGIAGVAEYFEVVAAPVKAAGLALLCAAVAAHALLNYSFYPSDCCTLVHADDLVALDWIGRNLPGDALIAIPQAQLQDAPPPYPALNAATDAGVWIAPLTGRQTASLPYSTDFGRLAARNALCRAGVDEVYVSTMPQGFNPAYLEAERDWYELDLRLPGVRIYRVTGCTS